MLHSRSKTTGWTTSTASSLPFAEWPVSKSSSQGTQPIQAEYQAAPATAEKLLKVGEHPRNMNPLRSIMRLTLSAARS